jgi:hypothetical protein
MSSPFAKNILLPISANQNYKRPVSSPRRGVGHRHQTLGWDCGGRGSVGRRLAPGRSAVRVRRSRVVLTPRHWRQVGGYPAGDGGNQAAHRGERVISRKAIAQGMSVCSPLPCMLVCAFVCAVCTRDRGCSAHPAFPAPSVLEEGQRICKARAKTCREIARSWLVSCAVRGQDLRPGRERGGVNPSPAQHPG